jgi:hypothetical protein
MHGTLAGKRAKGFSVAAHEFAAVVEVSFFFEEGVLAHGKHLFGRFLRIIVVDVTSELILITTSREHMTLPRERFEQPGIPLQPKSEVATMPILEAKNLVNSIISSGRIYPHARNHPSAQRRSSPARAFCARQSTAPMHGIALVRQRLRPAHSKVVPPPRRRQTDHKTRTPPTRASRASPNAPPASNSSPARAAIGPSTLSIESAPAAHFPAAAAR